MKNFKLNIAFLAMFAMIFTSCSKDEAGDPSFDSEKATLSFGAIVNGLDGTRAASKQSIGEMPACSDDDPAYVRIVLMQGGVAVVGSADEPYRVNLATGQIFTVEDELLELDPGTYTLDHFSVYNADDELIWLAPRGGALADFVDVSLPLNIEVGAGVKKYVEVPVLCFDNRNVNEYGYLFFELNTNEAVEFCFFANFCDEDGRHYSARYSLDVWLGTNASGTPLYSDLVNTTGVNDDGDFFASPLCIALPTNDDDADYIYYELTLLDWDANYGDVDQNAAANRITGTLSRADIEANFGAGNQVEYEHLRFGCGDDDTTTPPPASECIPTPGAGCATLNFDQTVDVADFPVGIDPFYALNLNNNDVGTITFDLEASGADQLIVNIDLNEGYSVTDVEVSLPEFVDTEICVQQINENDFQVVYLVNESDFPEGINYPVEVDFRANICD